MYIKCLPLPCLMIAIVMSWTARSLYEPHRSCTTSRLMKKGCARFVFSTTSFHRVWNNSRKIVWKIFRMAEYSRLSLRQFCEANGERTKFAKFASATAPVCFCLAPQSFLQGQQQVPGVKKAKPVSIW